MPQRITPPGSSPYRPKGDAFCLNNPKPHMFRRPRPLTPIGWAPLASSSKLCLTELGAIDVCRAPALPTSGGAGKCLRQLDATERRTMDLPTPKRIGGKGKTYFISESAKASRGSSVLTSAVR